MDPALLLFYLVAAAFVFIMLSSMYAGYEKWQHDVKHDNKMKSIKEVEAEAHMLNVQLRKEEIELRKLAIQEQIEARKQALVMQKSKTMSTTTTSTTEETEEFVSSVPVQQGMVVQALDRGNFGTILNFHPKRNEVLVAFTSEEGRYAEVKLPIQKLRSQHGMELEFVVGRKAKPQQVEVEPAAGNA